jgi:hypothetical protein
MRPSRARLPNVENGVVPSLLSLAGLSETVERTLGGLHIEGLPAEPSAIRTTVHHGPDDTPRILFVINSSRESMEAVACAPGARSARDALTLETVLVKGEHAIVSVPGQSVRMLELSSLP